MKIATSLSVGIVLVLLLVCAAIGALAWPYVINTWLIFFHKEPLVMWWQGAILGLIPGLGQIILPLVVFTWVAMLFLP